MLNIAPPPRPGQTWLFIVVGMVHHFVESISVDVWAWTVLAGLLVHRASFATIVVGNAATHFGLVPHLLRRPPFSQHRHAPHDWVSVPSS